MGHQSRRKMVFDVYVKENMECREERKENYIYIED